MEQYNRVVGEIAMIDHFHDLVKEVAAGVDEEDDE